MLASLGFYAGIIEPELVASDHRIGWRQVLAQIVRPHSRFRAWNERLPVSQASPLLQVATAGQLDRRETDDALRVSFAATEVDCRQTDVDPLVIEHTHVVDVDIPPGPVRILVVGEFHVEGCAIRHILVDDTGAAILIDLVRLKDDAVVLPNLEIACRSDRYRPSIGPSPLRRVNKESVIQAEGEVTFIRTADRRRTGTSPPMSIRREDEAVVQQHSFVSPEGNGVQVVPHHVSHVHTLSAGGIPVQPISAVINSVEAL